MVINQLKHALRHGAVLRYTTFGIVTAVNVVFGALAYFNVLGFAAAVTAVSLSGSGLTVVIIINFVAGAANIKSFIGSPSGYIYALTPMKTSNILFIRIAAIVVQDVLALIISIYGTVWLSFYLADVEHNFLGSTIEGMKISSDVALAIVFGLLAYTFIYTFVVFCIVFKRSILFNKKGKSLLMIPFVPCAFWLLSLLDFIIFPFAIVERWFLFFNVTLYNALGVVIYATLFIIKTAILYVITSKLIDGRMNY
ncbi:MAG: hypothetical protein FWF94_07770 [Oscillospiraceae bacterium]|nr:hypothetical protein [Oscillospiraceae bacterium]